MKNYGYYSKLTGLYYTLTDHSKLRIWERFETLNIENEFFEFVKAMQNRKIDDTISNMKDGELIIVEVMSTGKVYVATLNGFDLCLKTCYKNNGDNRFKLKQPYKDTKVYWYQLWLDKSISEK